MKKFAVLILSLCLVLCACAMAEEPAAYNEYTIILQGAEYEIPATVCLPVDAENCPAVVMLHGTGSTRDEAGNGYAYAAPVLAATYGVATIRIDFPGNGESTADYMQYTFDSAVADALTAAAYMASLDCVDAEKLGVMGWSQGGTDAMLAAGRTDIFSSVVTWAGAPFMALDGFFCEADYEEAKQNGFFVMEFDWRENLNVSLQWCEDVMTTDVLAVFSAFEGPVLAIAGEEDDTVDPDCANQIVAVNTNEVSATCFIPGMDHTFNVFTGDLSALYTAIDATGTFFAETLK